MVVHKVSSLRLQCITFSSGVLFLIAFFVIHGPFAIRVICAMFSIFLLIESALFLLNSDIDIKDGSVVIIKLFNESFVDLSALSILNIVIPSRGPVFRTHTDRGTFLINYTSANYTALKDLVIRCKSSEVTLEELTSMVNNYRRSPT